MKLEYVYENNHNIKSLLKLGGLLMVAGFVFYSWKYSREFILRMAAKTALLWLVMCGILYIYNLYWMRQYRKLKEHGRAR